MKIEAVVLFDNMQTKRFKLKNPTGDFELCYKVNNINTKVPYKFQSDKCFLDKGLIFKKKCIYYKHGNIQPLDIDLNTKGIDINEYNAIVETNLFSMLVNSTKDRAKEMSMGLILGLAGIVGIVLVVLIG